METRQMLSIQLCYLRWSCLLHLLCFPILDAMSWDLLGSRQLMLANLVKWLLMMELELLHLAPQLRLRLLVVVADGHDVAVTDTVQPTYLDLVANNVMCRLEMLVMVGVLSLGQ